MRVISERVVPDLIWPYVVPLFADMDIWELMLAMEMDYYAEN